MTPEEIIELARQVTVGGEQIAVFTISELEVFTKLVAEKEREACAKICDKEVEEWKYDADVVDCAIAIRARGENK